MKSKTAAAGYKEASAGITHSQKLLCSPECRQFGASPNTRDQIHPASLLSCPAIPSHRKEGTTINTVATKLLALNSIFKFYWKFIQIPNLFYRIWEKYV